MDEKTVCAPVDLDALPDGCYITTAQLAATLGVHPLTPYKWVKTGRLPHPYKFGTSTRWKVGEVRQAIAQKAA